MPVYSNLCNIAAVAAGDYKYYMSPTAVLRFKHHPSATSARISDAVKPVYHSLLAT
jgi:hypothetical protein